MVLLVGLAVGVDYSMFYLRREREERAAGRSEREALEVAAATAGRSVLISGLTVMVAMAGLFLTADATFASFGLATIIVVGLAMVGSLTVLPALLSRLGDNVDRVHVPFAGRLRRDDGEGRSGARSSTASCAGRCSRRPRRGPARGARAAGPPAQAGRAGSGDLPAGPGRRPDLQPHAASVSGHAAPSQCRHHVRRRQRAGVRDAIQLLERRALQAAGCTSRSRSLSTPTRRSRT